MNSQKGEQQQRCEVFCSFYRYSLIVPNQRMRNTLSVKSREVLA